MITKTTKNWFVGLLGKTNNLRNVIFSRRLIGVDLAAPGTSDVSVHMSYGRIDHLPPVIKGKVLTTGHIANILGVPVHKIKYQITTLDIKHIAMAGDRRVFSQSALDKLAEIFKAKTS
jgi:hypothetical protein